MKVLSLKQPYAELVVSGEKTIELRKWNTKFRGNFLIHASLTPDKKAMKKFGFSDLPLGKIVGRTRLVDVKKYSSSEEFVKDAKKHLASQNWGNYGFVLSGAERIKEIDCKGKLGFWDFDWDGNV